jgi:hypothetical protein
MFLYSIQAISSKTDMSKSATLHTTGLALGTVFFGAMLVAFWPSYFSRLGNQPSYHAHAHGIAMTAWCALLIAQPLLIRMRHLRAHRWLGRVSFVLVPAIFIVTLDFLHFRLAGAGQLGDAALYVTALIVNALAAFGLIYALAIYYRKNAALHARFMIATIFPLFTPVTDRLIAANWPGLAALVPNIGGAVVLPAIGFLLADAILIALLVWDWRANRRFDAFAGALAISAIYHVSVLTFHELPDWRSFALWFQSLPI